MPEQNNKHGDIEDKVPQKESKQLMSYSVPQGIDEKPIKDDETPDGKFYQPEDFKNNISLVKELTTYVLTFLRDAFKGLEDYFTEGDFEISSSLETKQIKENKDLYLKHKKDKKKTISLADDVGLDPEEIANFYHRKIKIAKEKINYNKYENGDKLGSKQCARFVSETLGIPIIWNAEELFGRLCAEKDANGNCPNLKKDMSELRKGDVIFFKDTFPNGGTISHVGIIVADYPELMMRHHSTFLHGIKTVPFNQQYYEEHFYAAVTPASKVDENAG